MKKIINSALVVSITLVIIWWLNIPFLDSQKEKETAKL